MRAAHPFLYLRGQECLCGGASVEIRYLIWNQRNVLKLALHDVSKDEVEQVLDRDEWIPAISVDYPDQVRIIGASSAPRSVVACSQQF